jgi:hypothetical protein
MTPVPFEDYKSFWIFLIHSYFMNVLCYGCKNCLGICKDCPNFSTLSLESPDKICTYFLFFFISNSTTLIASGLRFECVFITKTIYGILSRAKYRIVAPTLVFANFGTYIPLFSNRFLLPKEIVIERCYFFNKISA